MLYKNSKIQRLKNLIIERIAESFHESLSSLIAEK